MLLPSASDTMTPLPLLLLVTAAAAVLSRMLLVGRRAASWSATAPMPSDGRQFWPADDEVQACMAAN
jgi:hypothetical protein